jgi:cytochrome c2
MVRDIVRWMAIAVAGLVVLYAANSMDKRVRGRKGDEVVVQASSGGDPHLGQLKIREYGCGSCHAVRGVPGAAGRVGPALNDLGGRLYLAGRLPNTTENLEEWIRHPQKMEPGTVMPNTGVSAEDARHMSAYLYSLR